MEKETHAEPSNKAWQKKNRLLHLAQWVLRRQRHSARKPAAVSPASGKGMEKETHAKPSNKAWPKKKNRLLHLVQWVLRRQRHSASKPAAVSPSSGKGQWKSPVGAVRPLQHDHLPHSPPISVGSSSRACLFYDGKPPPPSPPRECKLDSSDGTSLYGSTDLRGLCNANTRSDDADEEKSEAEGPNAIDVKAEEFIAKFYQQMRLQQMNSIKN